MLLAHLKESLPDLKCGVCLCFDFEVMPGQQCVAPPKANPYNVTVNEMNDYKRKQRLKRHGRVELEHTVILKCNNCSELTIIPRGAISSKPIQLMPSGYEPNAQHSLVSPA